MINIKPHIVLYHFVKYPSSTHDFIGLPSPLFLIPLFWERERERERKRERESQNQTKHMKKGVPTPHPPTHTHTHTHTQLNTTNGVVLNLNA